MTQRPQEALASPQCPPTGPAGPPGPGPGPPAPCAPSTSPKRSDELMALLPESCCSRDLASYCGGEKVRSAALCATDPELTRAKPPGC